MPTVFPYVIADELEERQKRDLLSYHRQKFYHYELHEFVVDRYRPPRIKKRLFFDERPGGAYILDEAKADDIIMATEWHYLWDGPEDVYLNLPPILSRGIKLLIANEDYYHTIFDAKQVRMFNKWVLLGNSPGRLPMGAVRDVDGNVVPDERMLDFMDDCYRIIDYEKELDHPIDPRTGKTVRPLTMQQVAGAYRRHVYAMKKWGEVGTGEVEPWMCAALERGFFK